MKKLGPGILVTAAFIGPGTVTTASIAGASHGYALVWALLFSVFATVILQEMAARLGVVSKQGLAENLCNSFNNKKLNRLALILIVSAIGVGNAAYQAGNISGAAIAAVNLTGFSASAVSICIGLIASILLFSGRYKVVESVLVTLVLGMSVLFLTTLLMIPIDWLALFNSIIQPSMPEHSSILVIALIGTTVVPYNLFLHTNAAVEKWQHSSSINQALDESRQDTLLSIGLGGLITLAIMSTAAAAFFNTGLTFSANNMASQLEPLLGSFAQYCFATGLLAAGLTSAITAPLAASYAVCGALGWPTTLKNVRFKAVWLTVMIVGTGFAATSVKPLSAILFAQAANGLLLPVIAIFLLIAMNNKALLGTHSNTWVSNLLGIIVVLAVSSLGLFKLWQLTL